MWVRLVKTIKKICSFHPLNIGELKKEIRNFQHISDWEVVNKDLANALLKLKTIKEKE